MIRLLCWAVFLVFLCAITPVMAAPDSRLVQHIEQFPMVYSGDCKVDSMKIKSVDCRIFFDAKSTVVWLCLYDKHGLTHIVGVKDSKETIVWCRSNVCI